MSGIWWQNGRGPPGCNVVVKWLQCSGQMGGMRWLNGWDVVAEWVDVVTEWVGHGG
jgi:hypothetical protein